MVQSSDTKRMTVGMQRKVLVFIIKDFLVEYENVLGRMSVFG